MIRYAYSPIEAGTFIWISLVLAASLAIMVGLYLGRDK